MAKHWKNDQTKPEIVAAGAPLRNRIVGSGELAVKDLVKNPKNWRKHPVSQLAALEGLLSEVGWVQNVIVNRTTGNMIDGHARVAIAEKRGEQTVPVVFVELTECEEELVLATLDPLGDLAELDKNKLQSLLQGLDPDSAALSSLIADLEAELGIGKEEAEPPMTLLDQAVQLEPAKEYIVIVCDDEGDWDEIKAKLTLATVRRGGYKAGSSFDATGIERVIPAGRLLKLLEASCS